jgi:hypothetical protein
MTTSVAADFAVQTPRRLRGPACVCSSAPQPLVTLERREERRVDVSEDDPGNGGKAGNGEGSNGDVSPVSISRDDVSPPQNKV